MKTILQNYTHIIATLIMTNKINVLFQVINIVFSF